MEEIIMLKKRFEKKVFVMGKVYDTAIMTDAEIQAEVQKDLDNYIGKDMVNFGITTTDKMVSLVFIRFTDYYKNKKVNTDENMIDADAYMVTGEGYDDFHMPMIFPTVPFGYTPYTMKQADFKQSYKESAEMLGADKVNWMKMEVTGNSVVLRIK